MEPCSDTKKRGSWKHSALIAFNETKRPCSPESLAYNSDLQKHSTQPTYWLFQTSITKSQTCKHFLPTQQQNKISMDLSPALHIPTDASKGNSLVSLQTLYIPWKHKLDFRLRCSQKHHIPSTLWALSNSPAVTWLICQAQRKFLTFNQATHTLSFLYLFTRIAPPHPPPSLFFFALSSPKICVPLLHWAPSSLQNSITPKRPPVLFYTKLPHQAFSSFSTFRRINATPLLFIIRAAFTPAHLLT